MTTDAVQVLTASEVTNGIAGKPGVLYQLNVAPFTFYRWNGTTLKELGADVVAAAVFSAQLTAPGAKLTKPVKEVLTGQPITGTAAITAAVLAFGSLIFTGGAGTQTLPTAALLATELGADAGTVFYFHVINVAGSGTCTVAVNTGIVAAAPVITGGATLTVANSATQGVGLFALVFTSTIAAVLFRVG